VPTTGTDGFSFRSSAAGIAPIGPTVPDVLAPWHDFYVVTGTAGATLVGLLFVAASIGSGVFTEEHRIPFRSFVSPSVVHFSSALAASLIALSAVRRWGFFALLEGGLGLFGLAYSSLVWRTMIRHGLTATIDLEDRICYAALPAFSYAILLAAAVLLATPRAAGLAVLAGGVGLLLLVGIRNAWDITTWTITRHRD